MDYLTDQIKDKLHLSLKSTDMITAFLDLLDRKIISLGQPKSQYETSLVSNNHEDLLHEIFDMAKVNPTDSIQVKDFLSAIRQYLVSSPVIDLEVAFVPTNEFKDALFNWFRNNGYKHFFIKVSTNNEISAGFHISWKGNFINYDIEHVLENYLLENKDAINGLLQSEI